MTSHFFSALRMIMHTHSAFSPGEDKLLVTNATNIGASANLCLLLYSRLVSCPGVMAALKSEPQKSYVEGNMGFELLSWLQGKYGLKTTGVHVYRHLLGLFKAKQESKSLSVFVGDLEESRDALATGGMIIPDMMMSLFFILGLHDRYQTLKESFTVDCEKYMSLSLSELQEKARSFGAAMNFFSSSDTCSPAPSASAARTLRSRTPRSRLSDAEVQEVLDKLLSGLGCVICGDERHGLLINPCMALLKRDIIVKRDPAQARTTLERTRDNINYRRRSDS